MMKKNRGISFIEVLIAMVVLVTVAAIGYKTIFGVSRQQVADNSTKTANMIAEAVIDNFKFFSTFRNEWYDRETITAGGNSYTVANTYYPYFKPSDDHSLMPGQLDSSLHIQSLFTDSTNPNWQGGKYKTTVTIEKITADGVRQGTLTINWKEGHRDRTISRTFSLLPTTTRTPGFTMRQRIVDPLDPNGACTGIRGIRFEAIGYNDLPVFGVTDVQGEVILYGLKENVVGKIDGTQVVPSYYNKHHDATKEYTNSSLFKHFDFTFPSNQTIAINPLNDEEDANGYIMAGTGSDVTDPCPGALNMYKFGGIAGDVLDVADGSTPAPNYLLHLRAVRLHVPNYGTEFIEKVTDGNGAYSFSNLMPGQYYIAPIGTSKMEDPDNPNTPILSHQIPTRVDRNTFDNSLSNTHHPSTVQEHRVRFPMDPDPIDASNSAPLDPVGEAYAGMGWASDDTGPDLREVGVFRSSRTTNCARCLEVIEGQIYDSRLPAYSSVNANDLDASHFLVKKMADLTVSLGHITGVNTASPIPTPFQLNTGAFQSGNANITLLAANNPWDFHPPGLTYYGYGFNGNPTAEQDNDFGGIWAINMGYVRRNFKINNVFTDLMGARADTNGQVVFRNLANPITLRDDSSYPHTLNNFLNTQTDAIELAPFSYGNGLAPVLAVKDHNDEWRFIVYTGDKKAGYDYPRFYKVIPARMGFSVALNSEPEITHYVPFSPSGYFSPNLGLSYYLYKYPVGANDTTINGKIYTVPSNLMSNISGQILNISCPTASAPYFEPWIPPSGTQNDILNASITTWGIQRETDTDKNSAGWFTFRYPATITVGPPSTYSFNPSSPFDAGNNRVLPSLGYYESNQTVGNDYSGDVRFVEFSFVQDIADEQMYLATRLRMNKKMWVPLTSTWEMRYDTQYARTTYNGAYEITNAAGTILAVGGSGVLQEDPQDLGSGAQGIRSFSTYDTPTAMPTVNVHEGHIDRSQEMANTVGGISLLPGENRSANIVVNPPNSRNDPVYVRFRAATSNGLVVYVDENAPGPTDVGVVARECDTDLQGWNLQGWCAPHLNYIDQDSGDSLSTGVWTKFYGAEEIIEMYVQVPAREIILNITDQSSTPNPIDNATVVIRTTSLEQLKNTGNKWKLHTPTLTTDGSFGSPGMIALDRYSSAPLNSPVVDYIPGYNIWFEVSAPGYQTKRVLREISYATIFSETIQLSPLPAGGPGPSNPGEGL